MSRLYRNILYTESVKVSSVTVGVSGRPGGGGSGERAAHGDELAALARSPPARLATHGRSAARDAVSRAARNLLQIRVRRR